MFYDAAYKVSGNVSAGSYFSLEVNHQLKSSWDTAFGTSRNAEIVIDIQEWYKFPFIIQPIET